VAGVVILWTSSTAFAEGGQEPALVSQDAYRAALAKQEADLDAIEAEEAGEEKAAAVPLPPRRPGSKVASLPVKEPAQADEVEPAKDLARATAVPPPVKKIETASVEPAVEVTEDEPVQRGVIKRDMVSAASLKPLIHRHAEANNLPFGLVDAVVRIESRYQVAARNGPNIGLTQINATTARSLGFQGTVAELHEPENNLRYGVKYLAMAYKLAGGDTCGTILRYQFGHRTTTMTAASRKYCERVKVITAEAN
jgi:soluble lytic murein transglycosylase-like protein